ncbi:unnamed protein product [Didymodactylos carnosus]|uniref:Uncharacterized protein n=1 Tax=Didymodactylos carnosus TaxID=1234261 RepID=A0A815Z5V0_9BILA|nr:unnamed protein product [Didymodactylos carnosus]CAF4447870.1 unnamed protein product [Didymodactylos carnosus]
MTTTDFIVNDDDPISSTSNHNNAIITVPLKQLSDSARMSPDEYGQICANTLQENDDYDNYLFEKINIKQNKLGLYLINMRQKIYNEFYKPQEKIFRLLLKFTTLCLFIIYLGFAMSPRYGRFRDPVFQRPDFQAGKLFETKNVFDPAI